MDINEIIKCTEALSKSLGLCISDKRQLKKNLKQKIPVTTLYYNEEFTLWVNRFFISYSKKGFLDIWYIYITKRHINEEMRGMKAQINNNTDFLSYIQQSNLREQKKEALRKMRMSGIDYYIFYNNLDELPKNFRSKKAMI